MTDPIAPIGSAAGGAYDHRQPKDDATTNPATPSRALAPLAPIPRAREQASDSLLSGLSAFAAQLLGQPGRKRGLKGGPPVLDEAKSAYLEAEYSGPNDRRARTGVITRTDV